MRLGASFPWKEGSPFYVALWKYIMPKAYRVNVIHMRYLTFLRHRDISESSAFKKRDFFKAPVLSEKRAQMVAIRYVENFHNIFTQIEWLVHLATEDVTFWQTSQNQVAELCNLSKKEKKFCFLKKMFKIQNSGFINARQSSDRVFCC